MKIISAHLSWIMAAATAGLASWPALAQEADVKKSGLPQFDLTFFPGQIFWLAISFITLYLLMAFVAIPRVKKTQGTRHEILTTDLAAAEAANEAAKLTIEQFEKALKDARLKAQVTVTQMTIANAKEATERQQEQHRGITKRLSEAEGKIAVARDAVIKNIEASADQLAVSIIDRVSGLKLEINR